MAYEEEFVEETETEQDPFSQFGGKTIQKTKKTESDPFAQFGGTLVKKKVGGVESSPTESKSTSQKTIDVKAELTPINSKIPEIKPTSKGSFHEDAITQAIQKDKVKENSYLGAVWNNLVGSMQRLAGGVVRAESFNDPVSLALRSSDEQLGTNLAQLREMQLSKGAKDVFGNLRTDASSKENENKIIEGFDITDGIGWEDFKALGVMIPSMIADMGMGAATLGTTFAIQGYDDVLAELDEATKDKPVAPLTRQVFGLGGATITAALEKVGLDNIIKVPALKKYAVSKIVNETADELIQKGVKVTADQFEKTILKNAENFAKKEIAKKTIQGAARGLLAEGTTEALQEGGVDLMRLAANKLENAQIFDEDEMKDSIAKRYLNSFAVGGLMGGVGGAAFSRFGNTQRAIEESLKKAKTPEEIKSIIEQVNANIESGAIPPENAQDIAPILEKYTTILQPSDIRKPEIVEKGNKFEQGDDGKFTAYKKGEVIVDESGAPIKFDTIQDAKEAVRVSETKPKGEPEQISKPIELSIDETTQTTEVPVKTETKIGEPKATTETIGTTEVTEEELPKDSLLKKLKEINAPEKLIENINEKAKILKFKDESFKEWVDKSGYYTEGDNDIHINPFASIIRLDPKGKDKTIIHEAVHLVTTDAINTYLNGDLSKIPLKAIDSLDYIYDSFNKSKDNYKNIKPPYGFSNLYEFVSEFVSNPSFRQIVARNLGGNKSTLNKILDSIKDFISVMTGIEIKSNINIDNLEKINNEIESIYYKKEIIKPKKTEPNAIQEPSTESLLQSQQEEIGETGSGRERVEQGEQRIETSRTRKEGEVEADVYGKEVAVKYEQANAIKGEKAKFRAKEKIIKDNFESVVAQLMTKNKIKRICP